jgi:hypothetical protein
MPSKTTITTKILIGMVNGLFYIVGATFVNALKMFDYGREPGSEQSDVFQ